MGIRHSLHSVPACLAAVALVTSAAQAAVIDDIQRSRPDIAAELADRPAVRTWIAAQFDADVIDLKVLWEAVEPKSGRAAEHEYLSSRGPVVIRVTERVSPLDQLAGLIFELHNMRGYRVFAQIYQDAVEGRIGPEEYGLRNLAQEFEARVANRAFLLEHFSDVPARELAGHRVLAGLLQPVASPADQLAQARRQGGDLLEHYHEIFDAYVVPERELRTRIAAVASALERCAVGELDDLVADGYRHTEGGHRPLLKAEWLARLAGLSAEQCANSRRSIAGDLDIVIREDTAVVNGETRGNARRRFTAVWIRTPRGWQRTAFHDAPAQ